MRFLEIQAVMGDTFFYNRLKSFEKQKLDT